MSLSRRDFIRNAGTTAVTATLPFLFSSKAVAGGGSPVQPHYRVRYWGANLKPWCFDRSRRYRRQQIAQLRSWGFERLRDNHPTSRPGTYDLNHSVRVMEECLAAGIQYTITGADRNAGMENIVTQAQRDALMSRYNGSVDHSRQAIAAIGIGGMDPVVTSYLLDQTLWLRGLFPQGVRMQAYNGPELDGAGPWNMYNPEFREWARGIGFLVPPLTDEINDVIAANYDNFAGQMQQVWGGPWLYKSSHVYQYTDPTYGTQIFMYPWQPERWQPVITEWGVSRSDIPDRPTAFRQFAFSVIDRYAQEGYQSIRDGVTYNVEEMFLHEPLSPGFLDLWEAGDTRPLWNTRKLSVFLGHLTDGRQLPTDYSFIMMDAPNARAVRDAAAILKANRTRN